MKLINRYIIILVLFNETVKYCFGEVVRLNFCETEDCLETGKDFDRLIDSYTKRCDDFYKFACGNGPPEELTDLYRTQEEYLRHKLEVFIVDDDSFNISPPSPTDSLLMQLIKRHYKLCDNEGLPNSVETGLRPIISFLNEIPAMDSWWELENWSVSIGMDSILFSIKIESHLNRKDKKGAIILGPPDTRMYATQSTDRLIAKLREQGLNDTLANKLAYRRDTESELYPIVQDSWYANHERNLTPISNWQDLWEKNRTKPIGQKQIDFEMYLEKYWNTSIITESGIIPVLKNSLFQQWIEYPPFVTGFGLQLQYFSEDELKNIIVWRMVTQLVEYGPQGIRDILELPPISQKCRSPYKNAVLQKVYWSKVFPNSLKKSVKKIYVKIDFQLKLLNYKLAPKISPELEPLTHREEKALAQLSENKLIVANKVKSLRCEQKNAEKHLRQLTADSEKWCFEYGRNFAVCDDVRKRKIIAKTEIPKVRERIALIKEELPTKVDELARSEARLANFQRKHAAQLQHSPGVILDVKRRALVRYLENKSYPKFPFEITFTQPNVIVKALPKNPTYVDIALALKEWERAILLRPPEVLDIESSDMKFIIHTFSNKKFARFMKNRPGSLNYGALGSVIGSQQMRQIIDFQMAITGGMENHEICRQEQCIDSPSNDEVESEKCELSIEGFGLQAAWNAYKCDVAINGYSDERLLRTSSDATGVITKLNHDQLFFLSFANAHCAQKDAGTFVNDTLKQLSTFYEVFSCANSTKG